MRHNESLTELTRPRKGEGGRAKGGILDFGKVTGDW